ncbi:MAG: GDYXXLXY domain-containing protein [Armatimonadota bacterium]|nr:GDYXXLXY domain-containing protein [Armatimonadota bacterium]
MRRTLFALIVSLQLLFLVAEAGSFERTVRRGPTIVLKVVPVDPRSLFMGQYMWLNYEACDLELSTLLYDPAVLDLQWGDPLYVSFTPEKPWARARAVSGALPPPSADVHLRARVIHVDPVGSVLKYETPEKPIYRTTPFIRVDYGLDRYFIPETKQEEVLRLTRWRPSDQPEILAEIAVDKKGKGFLRRIIVNGKPVEF